MKKLAILLLFIIVSPVIAGVYGIILNEISYTISPEFFTKFRFVELGLVDTSGRTGVALIGWMNGWFMGLLVGTPLSISGLIHKNEFQMFKYTLHAFLITIVTTILVSGLGFLAGKYILTEDVVKWNLPEKISDPNTFVALETMNNFSYMGGTAGMLLAILWQIRQKKKDENIFSTPLN